MNIDAPVAPASPTSVQKHGGAAARNRAPDDAPGAASFLSLLRAQETPVTDPAVATDAADAVVQPEQPGADDATALPQSSVLPAAPVPAAAPQAGSTPASAQSGSGAADAASPIELAADAAADRAAALDDADPAQAAALKAASATSRSAGAVAVGEADAQARQQTAEALASARDAAARVEPSAKDAEATQWRTQMPSPAGPSATAVVSMFEAGLVGVRAGPGARAHERGAARVNASEAAGAGFVPWSDATPGSSAPQTSSPVYAPTVGAPVLSAALAQKMHYWVAGGVQSAELQLDAFGGGAVDVRIAVKGDEAFVEFRSDQAQARKLLLDAMPQLKELLAGEGLMLSGGFVGGSGQDSSAGARSGRSAGMRTASAPVQEVAGRLDAPALKVSGQSIDLFV
ncbi:flagellar hook-length control protein FliK [Comamonadaceae bacterium G21597-S1]|nr:flagellar hook-length control protein FliK [Comamonadaceae bacterium G21597-S1]